MSAARLLWAVSIGSTVALLSATVLTATGEIPTDEGWDSGLLVLYLAMQVSFAWIGALLVTRVPGNRVGWIMWIAGVALTIAAIGHLGSSWVYAQRGADPIGTLGAWASVVATQIAFSLIMAFLPLLFPTGRPPTRAWRPLVAYGFVTTTIAVVVAAVTPGPLSGTYPVANPLGVPVIGEQADAVGTIQAILLLTFIPACGASLVARYRRGNGIERQQVKWFAAVVSVMVGFFAVAVLAPNQDMANLTWGLATAMLPLLPIAIGIAVLRYRLYEIDRLISRTIGWAVVTGLLVAVFAALVVGLQAALTGVTQGQTLAVAASTLAAAALFQPVRERVQRAVDRRFDRARYDAERTAAAFADRLRDETDIATVTGDLLMTTGDALAPAGSGLWLRGTGR